MSKITLNEIYPNKGESKKDFIARFMSATKDEYPDQKQRLAVAYSYWDRRKKEGLKEELVQVETRPFELEDILYWYNPEDGTCSAIIDYKKKKTRVRAGLLVIKNNKVLLCKNGAHFDLPGGSIELGETIEEAAKREAQEEVNITAKNIRETGFDYCTTNDELEDWVAENVPEKYQWYNYYTCLCIGEYSSEFRGKVDAIDKDPEMKNSADWYDIDTVVDNPEFLEPWRNALTKFGYYNKTLTEDLKDLAKDYFGETPNWKTCFYINTDGTLLDGSGKLFGSSSKDRTVDHREIADIFDYMSGNDAMLAYMKEGNIRFKPEAPGFEILIEPTEAQYKKIESLVNSFYGNYYLDFSNQDGKIIKSNEYTTKDGLKIIDDIKDYFKLIKETLMEDLNDMSVKRIEAILEMPYEEAINIVKNDILNICADNYIDIAINDIAFTGSQRFGNPNSNSDLDVVFSYSDTNDNIREDDLFNILNEDSLYLNGYKLDINPLKDIDLDFYLKQASSYKKESLSESLVTEATRNTLLSKSKNTGLYKDTSRGKNRFERKRLSRIASTVKEYNKIDMNDFFKKDLLTIDIPVIGETDSYLVSIRMDGVLKEIANNIKTNGNKFEYRTVLQALTKIFNTANIYVHCSCDDFKFTFDNWSVVNSYGTTDSAHAPGPGKGIRNPNDNKGIGCKHILLVLSNLVWINNVASVIKNYITWMAEHEPKLFAQVIFPKMYNMSEEDAQESGLIPEDVKLDSEQHLIDKINEWAKNRGKYQPGSNKNPVTNTGGRAKKEEEKPEEETK